MRASNPHYIPGRRQTEKLGETTIIRRMGGSLQKRIMIGVATLGVIRVEWDVHRRGQVIPINWQCGEVTANHLPDTFGMGYHTADAQNLCLERAYLDKYEWLLLWEDDVLAPFDSMLRLAVHMEKMRAPIISGLYFSKSEPTWPLIFRGRGNGAFLDFKLGETKDRNGKITYDGLVWADGVPTGFCLIHSSIFRWAWENSPDYQLPDGRKIKRVFKFPRESWFDPELDRYFAQMGTSDLDFCDRLMRENAFAKTGWTDLAKKKYPLLVDTNLYAQQIDLGGKLYPNNCGEILPPREGFMVPGDRRVVTRQQAKQKLNLGKAAKPKKKRRAA